MAKLSYRDAEGVLREHELGEQTTIGRHPNQMIQVLDRVVSKQHAVIEKGDDGAFYLVDGGSRNGTYLNGTMIDDPVQLSNGDRVTIGSTDLYFQDEAEAERRDSLQQAESGAVTIHNEDVQTHIRSRLGEQVEHRFLPEEEIDDEDDLRRDYEKLRIAHELSSSIGLEMDLDTLLKKILDKAFELFPADRGVILLKDEETDKLTPMETRSETEEGDSDVRISETILTEVAEKQEAFLSSDAMSDSRFSGSESILVGQIRSTMSVPMLHDEELYGVIHLDTKMASGAFTEKDLQILTGFGRRAAELVEHHRLLKRMEDEIVVREQVRRLLPPELVQEVVDGRISLEKGGELRRTTVMYADICNFTSYSEKMAATEVVNNINQYFEVMVDVIFEYEGTLDKFIGDEIMAIWGAPVSQPDDADRAVKCGIAIQEALAQYNEHRRKEGRVTFEVGVGLNTGEVAAGYMGSTKRMNYTVIGDPVNTAARICSEAGPGDVYLGENTFEEVGHMLEYEQLPEKQLKGKARHVDIYAVHGLADRESGTDEEPTLPERSIEETR